MTQYAAAKTADIDPDGARFEVRSVALFHKVRYLCLVGKCPRARVIERSS